MLTIGHSTLEIEAFLRALRESGVHDAGGCDGGFRGRGGIRSLGRRDCLLRWRRQGLGRFGVRVWVGGVAARKDSVNTGWKNESFRGYADYMQTPEFAAEIDWLVGQPELDRLAVMCAEAVPWRCHRSLIADAVMARGVEVQDVFVTADGRGYA